SQRVIFSSGLVTRDVNHSLMAYVLSSEFKSGQSKQGWLPRHGFYSQVRNSWRQRQNRPDFKTTSQKYVFHVLQPNHVEFHRSKCSIFETCLWQSLRTK